MSYRDGNRELNPYFQSKDGQLHSNIFDMQAANARWEQQERLIAEMKRQNDLLGNSENSTSDSSSDYDFDSYNGCTDSKVGNFFIHSLVTIGIMIFVYVFGNMFIEASTIYSILGFFGFILVLQLVITIGSAIALETDYNILKNNYKKLKEENSDLSKELYNIKKKE